MSLFGIKEKQELEALRSENQSVTEKNAALEQELEELKKQNGALSATVDSFPKNLPSYNDIQEEIKKRTAYLAGLKATISDTEDKLKTAKQSLIEVSDAVQLQDFGLYTPHYNLMHADEYKAKMMEIRALQKDMVRNGSAVTGSQTWASTRANWTRACSPPESCWYIRAP